MEGSLIRFACVTTPQMDSAGIAPGYCEAVEKTGLGVRIMSIGMTRFDTEPWDKLSHLFLKPLKTQFINVVCVEPGVTLGNPVSQAQFGAEGATGDAYEPPLALVGLFTVGEKGIGSTWFQRAWHWVFGGSIKASTSIPNVAILSGYKIPEGVELEALKHYDAILCPTQRGSDALNTLGLKTKVVPPDSAQLSKLFSGMMPA